MSDTNIQEKPEIDQLAVNTIRILCAEGVQKANLGTNWVIA